MPIAWVNRSWPTAGQYVFSVFVTAVNMTILKTIFIFIICASCNGIISDQFKYTYIGCYDLHFFTGNYTELTTFNSSPEECFIFCVKSAYRYAGLEIIEVTPKNYTYYSCYCGNDTLMAKKYDEDECKPCSRTITTTCGEIRRLSIYKINVLHGADIILCGQDRVDLLNTSVLNNRTLVRSSSLVTAVDYHYERSEGFAIWSNQIYRFPLFPNDLESVDHPSEVLSTTRCETFTIDWLHDRIYWPDCSSYSYIMMSDLDGTNQAVLLQLSEGIHVWVVDILVDPYKGMLFWIMDHSIMSCELDGRNLRTMFAAVPDQHVTALALDPAAERIYFCGQVDKSARVFYANYKGSDWYLLHTFSQDYLQIWSFGFFRSTVYFLTHFPGNEFYLVKYSTNGNLSSPEKILIESEMINHMKIFHPDLQLPAKVDSCTYKGCSHHCIVNPEIPQLSTCHCPRFQKLGDDGQTCELSERRRNDRTVLLNVISGSVCILFVLLAAGVLMCMCDKLWSKIHPTVVRLTDPRTLQRQIVNQQTQDSEHLI